MDTIRRTDAILAGGDTGNPQETEWPAAEFIIGNPPFLGHFPFREQLGDEYVNAVYSLFGDRIPNYSDLCCYWFEKARAQIEASKSRRAGLLATQAIRFQSNRPVLARIKETGDIFAAISDKDWILEGANVNISIICFDDGSEIRTHPRPRACRQHPRRPDLGRRHHASQGTDRKRQHQLYGRYQGRPFEISSDTALEMLRQPNPHGKPNSDVVKRWMIGRDINQRSRNMWIVDFGVDMPESEAALYELPFEYVAANVKPDRIQNRRPPLCGTVVDTR